MKKTFGVIGLSAFLLFSNISGYSVADASAITYTVKKGDSLYGIAKKNNVSVGELKTWNGLKSDTIKIGQVLKLSSKTVSPPNKEDDKEIPSSAKTYQVKKGDTLSRISKTYGVSVANLKKWNNLTSDTIRIGQVLKVSGDSGASTQVPSTVKDESPLKPLKAPVYPKDGVKGVYVSEHSIANPAKFNNLLGLLDRTELNTMVINVKNDDGRITYDSNSSTVNAYQADTTTIKNTKQLIQTLENKNIYSVARIVTFKDPYMAKKNQKWAMKKHNGELFYLDGAYWIEPYNKEYWVYVVNIAKEAASLGFDEIQFDYVRFPSNKNNQVDSQVKFNNPDKKSKEQIIGEFLDYAKKELKPYGVKISADIFAFSMGVEGDSGIGQKWETMTQRVDVTSPMIYPSHYIDGNFGVKDPIKNPYNIVKKSIELAHAKENVLRKNGKHVAEMRPWLQDFSQHGVTYDANKVKAQIQAAKELGVDEYLMWNAQNTYTESAFKKK